MSLDDGDISIHALREEGDTRGSVAIIKAQKFQSTPSARRATVAVPGLVHAVVISIHALREEGDIFRHPGIPTT